VDIIQRTLVTNMSSELDIVPLDVFEKEQRRTTGGRGQPARFAPEGYAAAGRAVGASFVLIIDLSRAGYLYTAHAQLVSTTSAAISMDFRSGYYRPAIEAADRGARIARKTVAKISLLAAAQHAIGASGTSTLTVSLTQKVSEAHETLPEAADSSAEAFKARAGWRRPSAGSPIWKPR
jgi:hypothetical protein